MRYGRAAKRIIFIVLTILWCRVIFGFSAENAQESTETSSSFIGTICDYVVPEFDSFSGEQRDEFVDSLQFYVRKCAHFSAYCLLGLLAFQSLDLIERKKIRTLSAVAFGFLYACTDEFHQSFVPGRSPEIRDVCIDTLGTVLGAVISLLITIAISKKLGISGVGKFKS